MPSLHSGAAIDRTEVTHLALPPIPEVVWQQPHETHLIKILKVVLTKETHKNNKLPELKQKKNVKPQMSPIKETSSQVS